MTDAASSSKSMPLILLDDELETKAATVAIAGAVTGAVTDTTNTAGAAAGVKGAVALLDCCASGSVVGPSRRLLALPVASSTSFCSLTEDAASDLLTDSGVSVLIDCVSKLSFCS